MAKPVLLPFGNLDTAFSGDGLAGAAIGTGHDQARALAIQADGKYVLAGWSDIDGTAGTDHDFAVMRFNADGSLDTTFSGDGRQTTGFTLLGSDEAYGVAIQADGKIVVGGSSNIGIFAAETADFALVRYNADGSLDSTFGTGGKVTTPLAFKDLVGEIVIQADGRILVVGASDMNSDNGLTGKTALVRYNSNGSLDTTFGIGGIASANFSGFENGEAVALQADGRIVVAGYVFTGTEYDFTVARFNTNGTFDSTFGNAVGGVDGMATFDLNEFDQINAVAIQADGRILLAGTTGINVNGTASDAVLIRLNADGSLDTGFDGISNGNGIVTLNVSGSDSFNSVVVQADGKILAAGSDGLGLGEALFARFNANGTLDTSFSGDGVFSTDFGSGTSSIHDLAVMPNGQVVAAGDSFTGTFDFGLLRLGTGLGDRIATSGDAFSFTVPAGTFLDPDGDPLTFTATLANGSALPSWLTFNAGTQTFSGTPADGDFGTHQVKVTASDASASVSGNFQLEVTTDFIEALRDTEHARWNDASPNGTAGTALTFSFMTVAPSYSDPETEQASFQVFTEAQKTAVRTVLDLYEEIAGVTFTEVLDNADGGKGGQLRFGNNSQDPLATSAYAYSPGGIEQSGDVWVNKEIDANLAPDVGTFAFATLLHEVGHALGLKHPGSYPGDPGVPPFLVDAGVDNDQFTVMSYNLRAGSLFLDVTPIEPDPFFAFAYRTVTASTQMLFDVAAIQFLYGANLATRSGDNTYTFDPAAPFFKTLWDGGGTDTISLSNFTQASVIDLRDGHFSTLRILSEPLPPDFTGVSGDYDGTNNLAIAFDTIIENATGGAGNDTLTGNAVGNVLNGGAGVDTMAGGLGNDTYVVNSVQDVVTEAASAGTDLVQSAATGHTLSANVENLTLTGTGAINGTGNTGNNVLTGNSGNNTLNGGTGNDTASYASAAAGVTVNLGVAGAQNTIGAGTDTLTSIENLTGGASNDTLTGDVNANTLDGGAGNDTLSGGAGNDTYVVNSTLDVVTEASSAGTDLVQSAATAHTLSVNVENLTLTGTAAINGTGNTGNNVLTGNSGNNTLNGSTGTDTASYASATAGVTVNLGTAAQNTIGAGTDTLASIERLTGSAFNDTLTGNTSTNLLDGGVGADTMAGGLGNDTYVVNSTLDVVTEASSAGTDLVQSSAAAHTLSVNVENLTLTGTAAIIGTGNTGNNVLTGNSGNNTLTGGAGADSYQFSSALGATNIDQVAGFVVVDDTIRLENAIFTSLVTPGALAAASFRTGAGFTAAADANDFIIFNTSTGQLFYDAGGNTGAASQHFATLTGVVGVLAAADFLIV